MSVSQTLEPRVSKSGTSPRRPRLPREETRRRILEAARARVLSDGAGTGLENVRLEDAIRDADVSRTAAYRCWPGREDFLPDLLAALAEDALPVASTRNAQATALLRSVVGEDAARLRTVEMRRELLRQVVAAAADEDLRADREERGRWRLFLTLALAVPALPEGEARDRAAAAVAAAEETVLQRLEANYRRLLELFGFTAVDTDGAGGTGYRRLARIGLALMRGYVVGNYAGSGDEAAGEAYVLLVDAATRPVDTADWDDERGRGVIAALAGEVFEDPSVGAGE